jgi:hypothetical protein
VNGNPTAFQLTLHATDGESDTLTWSISTPADYGTASVPASNTGNSMDIGYVPAKNRAGPASFVITVDDAFGGTDTITVNVKVQQPTLTFQSTGTTDGQVLESGENTNVGGTIESTYNTFTLGDDALNRQYRGILSFKTGPIPDNAIITSITLQIKNQSGTVAANSAFAALGNIVVDIKAGPFGGEVLEAADFQALATKNAGMTITNTPLAGGWYSVKLTANANTLINKVGPTQFRLRFAADDNNDHIANLLKFFSGNAATVANQPVLIIQYYVPLP